MNFQDLEAGKWAQINPFKCPCRGLGWVASYYDTVHACPIHLIGQPRPEDESQDFSPAPSHKDVCRHSYRIMRDAAQEVGMPKAVFNQKVCALMQPLPKSETVLWMKAAETVMVDAILDHEERSMLERDWATDGYLESIGW